MRFSLVTVFTFTGLLATTLANPVPIGTAALQTRGIDEQGSTLDDLQDTIKSLTSKIDRTMENVPEDISDDEAAEIKADLEPILEKLKEALAEATKLIAQDQDATEDKRDLVPRGCSDQCLVEKSNKIIAQVAATLKGVVKGLGADRVTVIVKPVLSEVKGLLSCLDGTVKGVLKIGTGLLGSLLGGCGLDSLLNDLLGGILGDSLGDILGGGDLGGILKGLLGDDGLLGGLLGDGGLLGGLLGGGDDDDDGLGGLIGGLFGKN